MLTITNETQKKNTATPIPAGLAEWDKISGAMTKAITPDPEFNPTENAVKKNKFALIARNRPVSSVVKRTLSVREDLDSIPGSVKSAQCRQRLVTVVIRSSAAYALNSRGDGPCHSLHASP